MTKLAEKEVGETVEDETPESQDPNTVATCALAFGRLQERIKKSDSHSLSIPASALMLAQGEGSFEIEPASDDKTKPRRWKMDANSGRVIPHPYFGKFAVDMSGMKIGRQKKPVHEDHKTELKVGFSDTVAIDKKFHVRAGGAFLMNDTHAQKVMSNADDGYPFQASIFPFPDEIEFVQPGETALVNGMNMKGPGAILRKSRLRELSFCGLGADENTSSTALSGSELEVSITGTMLTNEEEEVETMAQEKTKEATPDPFEGLTVAQLSDKCPALLDEIKIEAVKLGVSQERDRVKGIIEASKLTPEETKRFTLAAEINVAILDNSTVDEAKLAFSQSKVTQMLSGAAPPVGGNAERTAEEDAAKLNPGKRDRNADRLAALAYQQKNPGTDYMTALKAVVGTETQV